MQHCGSVLDKAKKCQQKKNVLSRKKFIITKAKIKEDTKYKR